MSITKRKTPVNYGHVWWAVNLEKKNVQIVTKYYCKLYNTYVHG